MTNRTPTQVAHMRQHAPPDSEGNVAAPEPFSGTAGLTEHRRGEGYEYRTKRTV